MLTYATHRALDLTLYEVDQWDWPTHQHQFLELVYVLDGHGTHTINELRYAYAPGSLFLLTPADAHAFAVAAPSRFAILVVTELYAHTVAPGPDAGIYQQLEYIFLNHRLHNGEPVRQPADRAWVGQLVHRLLAEVADRPVRHEAVVAHLVALLLHQVARAVQENNRPTGASAPAHGLAYDVSSYIQQHIYANERLRLDALAAAFHHTKATLAQRFKEQTGGTIKDYILRYKLNLAKARLQFSDQSVAQIADELGFADESHLNKLFRQREGLTATAFRRQGRPALADGSG